VLGGFRDRQAQKTEALRSRLVEADAQLRSIDVFNVLSQSTKEERKLP